MGRFEELIEQAKEGDTTALDALQEEFSVSTLREKAEQAGTLQSKYDEVLPYVRQAKVNELVGQLDDDLKESGLTADDFADADPDSLTLELIQGKARERVESRNTQKLASANDAGFDTVEEYESALQAVKQQQTERREKMESVATGVTSSGGETGDLGEVSTWDKSKEGFDKAKGEGATDDVAMARGIDAMLESQMEALGATE